MSWSINEQVNVDYVVFEDASASTFTNRTKTGDDLFEDDSVDGDRVWFGFNENTAPFKVWENLYLSISAAIASTAHSLIFKVYTRAGIVTYTLDADGTSGMTTTGEMKFRQDKIGRWQTQTVNGISALWVCFELSGVSGLTEGGAFNANPKGRNCQIKAVGETFTTRQLYDAVQASSYPYMMTEMENPQSVNAVQYFLPYRVYLTSSSAWNETLDISIMTYANHWTIGYWLDSDSSSSVTWGDYDSTYRSYLSSVKLQYITTSGGSIGSSNFNGPVTLNNCSLKIGNLYLNNANNILRHVTLTSGNRFYVNAQSDILDGSLLQMGSGQFAWGQIADNAYYEDSRIYMWNAGYITGASNGIGGFKRMDLSRCRVRGQSYNIQLIDCTFTPYTGAGGDENNLFWLAGSAGEWQAGRSLSLTVKDSSGSPISGVTVECKDKNSDNAFVLESSAITTDANGQITDKFIRMAKIADGDGDTWVDLRNLTLTLSKAGYETQTITISDEYNPSSRSPITSTYTLLPTASGGSSISHASV